MRTKSYVFYRRDRGYPWSGRELQKLTELVARKVAVGVIAYTLGRSPNAIRLKAEQMGLQVRGSDRRFRSQKTGMILQSRQISG